MPIYDFICRDCETHFDKLTSFDWRSAGITCPQCGSEKVVQAISRIGAFQSGGKMVMDSSACGTCHSGSCHSCH